MVVGRPLSDADDRRGAAARSFAAGTIQWPALRGALRHRLAGHAKRFAAMVGGLSANPTLAGGWLLRDPGAGFAGRPADGGGAAWRSDRRHHRQPNAAVDAGKWRPRRL